MESGERRSSFNHFAAYTLTGDYWRLSAEDQAGLRDDWTRRLREIAPAVHHYRTFAIDAHSDILIWCAIDGEDRLAPRRFFEGLAGAAHPLRRYLRLVQALWGFTQPSEYSRARSRGEIDPFEPRSEPYLIVYPFTKTADWYLLDAAARQTRMNEHIRVGKRYGGIKQLLLYSTGLQDQEFVVVYETADLRLFSRLVSDLRRTDARRFTKVDTPVHTAVHVPVTDADRLWP